MAKNPLKYLPITGILLLLFALGFFLFNARNKGVNGTVVDEVSSDSDASVTGKKIHYVQDNPDEGTKWVLDADEAIYSKDNRHISFKDFQIKFEPLNNPSLEIKGKQGAYDTTSKEISLWGDLQGHSSNGLSIFTEKIIFKQKDGILRTDEPVRITLPFYSVSGRGLLFDLGKDTCKIIYDVTTIIELKEGL